MRSQCFNDELVSSTVVWALIRICVWRRSVPAPAAVAKKKIMYVWTLFEPPDFLTTPEDWLD
jgi:hypothetical protein